MTAGGEEGVSLVAVDGRCNATYSCSSCTESRVCRPTDNGSFVEVFRLECSGATPFCDLDTGSCSSKETENCATTGEYTCLSDGVFPDPSDCGKFYRCEDLVSYSFKCITGNFDIISLSCQDEGFCSIFNCLGRNGHRIPHPEAMEYFAYCLDGQAYLVDKCKDGYWFDDGLQSCSPKCSKPGLVENPDNPATYFECKLIGGRLFSLPHSCGHSEIFNSTVARCVSNG